MHPESFSVVSDLPVSLASGTYDRPTDHMIGFHQAGGPAINPCGTGNIMIDVNCQESCPIIHSVSLTIHPTQSYEKSDRCRNREISIISKSPVAPY